MTRDEFYNTIDSFSELKDFCVDNDLRTMEDVFSDDERDDYLYDVIHDNNDYWADLRDWLNSIPTGYDWWVRDNWDAWEGIDEDDFPSWLDSVANEAEEEGVFDAEEDLEEDGCDPSEEDFEPPDEDFTISELFSESSAVFESLERDRIEAAAENEKKIMAEELELDKDFAAFMGVCPV